MSAPEGDFPATTTLGVGRPPWEVLAPERQTAALVFASPHSGSDYSAAFLAASKLDALTIRRSEDAFVDRIFAGVTHFGAPLIRATFPRAFVDPNREPYELDPAMYGDALPDYVNVRSPRVAAGLGTIARVVASGEDIYRDKLRFQEARHRIESLYAPYHRALARMVESTRRRFGACILIDCHSMPSIGGPMDTDKGANRVDMVLGDCHGTSCAPAITNLLAEQAAAEGFSVVRNNPYAGGYTTRHYGRPAEGVHALQIEINRGLYMDERTIAIGPGLAALRERIEGLVEVLAKIDPVAVTPP